MDWQGRFRTNYFAVKDEQVFRAWVSTLRADGKIEILERKESARVRFALAGVCGVPSDRDLTDEECAGIDPASPEAEAESFEEAFGEGMDFDTELAEHLPKGEIVIVQQVGYEGLRYLTAEAWTFNHRGERLSHMDLRDIFPLALQDSGVTAPEY